MGLKPENSKTAVVHTGQSAEDFNLTRHLTSSASLMLPKLMCCHFVGTLVLLANAPSSRACGTRFVRASFFECALFLQPFPLAHSKVKRYHIKSTKDISAGAEPVGPGTFTKEGGDILQFKINEQSNERILTFCYSFDRKY